MFKKLSVLIPVYNEKDTIIECVSNVLKAETLGLELEIIISDNNSKSLKIKKSLLKIFNNIKFKKPNISIIIGGDGFMLQTLKKNQNSKNFFYGINSGNYGFLMNKFSPKNRCSNSKHIA